MVSDWLVRPNVCWAMARCTGSASKTGATGSEVHSAPGMQVAKLDSVLTAPMLGHWQGQARAAKAAGR